MNFFTDILPMLLALAAIVLVMYLSFVFTKYIGKKINTHSRLNNIKVIEQVALGQDKALLIAEICGGFYLIGASAQNIEILKELDHVNLETEDNPMKVDFAQILNNVMKTKKKQTEDNHEGTEGEK